MFKENDNLDKNNDFFRETVINPNDKKAEESADSLDAMVYCHNILLPDMQEARQLADRLENLTAAECWPFPVYSDLLFSV